MYFHVSFVAVLKDIVHPKIRLLVSQKYNFMSLKISEITGTVIEDTEILCSIELKPQILKNITYQNL